MKRASKVVHCDRPERMAEAQRLSVQALPNQGLAMTNCLYINDRDFAALRARVPTPVNDIEAYGLPCSVKGVVFSVRPFATIAAGTIGAGGLQRRTAALSLNEMVEVAIFTRPAGNFHLAR